MPSVLKFDVIVVGAGMAGVSAAACIAESANVLLLEREAQPGYHSTGRTAALFSEIYGGPAIRALSRASREFLGAPPTTFSTEKLISARGVLYVARGDQLAALEKFADQPDVAGAIRRLTRDRALELSPLLLPDYVAQAVYEPDAADIDVHGLLGGYLWAFKERGGRLAVSAEVVHIDRVHSDWRIETSNGTFTAPVLVNASGAWADRVARMAGVRPRGIQPLRRTALIVDAPADFHDRNWPLTADIDERFYFKPESARILISPADETPVPATDVQPDEFDVAVAVDRVEAATRLKVDRIHAKWAGLRSFASDRIPVVGFDSDADGFFWLAGQGGYGIQTAPAMARLAALLIDQKSVPDEFLAYGLDIEDLSPSRPGLN